ncbi:MAG TPA: DUF4235 domain-containing protein [Solirubrobacteraceae bacterium]|nr:DUF4235 domain-containing protein [Solirubrobacteraceae bacterium]
MKLLYKPFSLIAGLIAARIGKAIFRGLWSRVDRAEPPKPTAPEAPMSKVVGAAALEAATMSAVAAAADRMAAEAFHHLTGVWPGKPAEPKKNS